MSFQVMSSVGVRLVLLSVLGVTVLSGCRTGKSDFSFAPQKRPTTSLASSGPFAAPGPQTNATAVPTPSTAGGQPATAATYSLPAGNAYTPALPSSYSPAPSKSSSGCSSGCCSG